MHEKYASITRVTNILILPRPDRSKVKELRKNFISFCLHFTDRGESGEISLKVTTHEEAFPNISEEGLWAREEIYKIYDYFILH